MNSTLRNIFLPMIGFLAVLIGWQIISGDTHQEKTPSGYSKTVKTGIVKDLPGPVKTWEATKKYITEPFAKREELDQGILRFTWYSLKVVAQGYLLALLIGTPIGFLLVLFMGAGKNANDLGALFTIAICSMWPTVLNTAVGVRAVPQDYLNVAKVLKLSPLTTLWKIYLPSTLPYMFTGFRLSLGIAWLVIVAVEMLTGRIGIGNFLWNEYNNGLYTSIILSILTIGIVGWGLDRLMSLIESRFKTA
jgi:nitrate/nitrite transport system permease protein